MASTNFSGAAGGVKNWILNSGIQEMKGANAGGFYSWFERDISKYSYVYSEITGYGITTLLFIHKYFGDGCIDKAVLAGKWIIEKAMHPSGGVRTREYLIKMAESENYSFESDIIYTFDTGMVLYGMINLYKDTGKKEFLDASEKMAGFLMKDMNKGNGYLYAFSNPNTGYMEDSNKKWSTQSGSYHAKLALGFTDLYDVTKQNRYKDMAVSLCRAALECQDASGRFITNRGDNSTHLHPHSYSAEGLVYAGLYFKEKDFVNSAVKSIEWILDNQDASGRTPKYFEDGKFSLYYRTDEMSQILRLGMIFMAHDLLSEPYLEKLSRLRAFLLKEQYSGNDSQNGGFYYGYTLDGVKKDHINSWCSMFALQALAFYDMVTNGEGIKKMEYLI